MGGEGIEHRVMRKNYTEDGGPVPRMIFLVSNLFLMK